MSNGAYVLWYSAIMISLAVQMISILSEDVDESIVIVMLALGKTVKRQIRWKYFSGGLLLVWSLESVSWIWFESIIIVMLTHGKTVEWQDKIKILRLWLKVFLWRIDTGTDGMNLRICNLSDLNFWFISHILPNLYYFEVILTWLPDCKGSF